VIAYRNNDLFRNLAEELPVSEAASLPDNAAWAGLRDIPKNRAVGILTFDELCHGRAPEFGSTNHETFDAKNASG
jgi:hypothetical protein